MTRKLSEASELADIARGATVLGSGGGGDPSVGEILARRSLQNNGPVTLVTVKEMPDDALVATVACLGAPIILGEKLPSGDESARAFRALQSHLGKQLTHALPVEIGGLNSMIPISVAADLGIPLIDADLMGRAFPEFHMVLPTLSGFSGSPFSMADEKGNAGVFDTIDGHWAERFARSISMDMGGVAFVCSWPMTGNELRKVAVPGTISLAQKLGASTRRSGDSADDAVETLRHALGGPLLMDGIVVEVERKTRGDLAHTRCVLEGAGRDRRAKVQLHAQTEFLLAERDGALIGCTPDLLVVIETKTGRPISVEEIRHGMQVCLLGSACDPRWRSPAGLELVGPRHFGFNVTYRPIEDLAVRPRP